MIFRRLYLFLIFFGVFNSVAKAQDSTQTLLNPSYPCTLRIGMPIMIRILNVAGNSNELKLEVEVFESLSERDFVLLHGKDSLQTFLEKEKSILKSGQRFVVNSEEVKTLFIKEEFSTLNTSFKLPEDLDNLKILVLGLMEEGFVWNAFFIGDQLVEVSNVLKN